MMACCCCDGPGVCCQGTTCTSVSSCECQQNGGTFRPNTTCSAAGACCLPDGTCVEQNACGCAAAGGTYKGDCASCRTDNLCGAGRPGTPCGTQAAVTVSGCVGAAACLNGTYILDRTFRTQAIDGCEFTDQFFTGGNSWAAFYEGNFGGVSKTGSNDAGMAFGFGFRSQNGPVGFVQAGGSFGYDGVFGCVSCQQSITAVNSRGAIPFSAVFSPRFFPDAQITVVFS